MNLPGRDILAEKVSNTEDRSYVVKNVSPWAVPDGIPYTHFHQIIEGHSSPGYRTVTSSLNIMPDEVLKRKG
jgi:hypothetical protein